MKEANQINDKVLISRLSRGDESAFVHFYKAKVGKLDAFLRNFGVKEFREDLIQETFIALWKNRRRIDPSLSLDSYLYTIAKNKALKALRKQITCELITDFEEKSLTPQQYLAFNELQEQLSIALDQLPERSRSVFIQRRMEGKSTAEIAKDFGITKSTVENHMNRALSFLRNELSSLSYLLFIISLFL